MNALQLTKDEYLPYFKSYIDQAGFIELIEGLRSGLDAMVSFYEAIPEDKLDHAYDTGKWTIKEIINHLIDSERVFCYRALRFARKDKTPLAGFDENEFATASEANSRTIKSLLNEYKNIRHSTIDLYNSFTPEMLKEKGVAGSGEVSVRALGFLIIGHEKHHKAIIKERYL